MNDRINLSDSSENCMQATEPCRCKGEACTKVSRQFTNVSLPIEIKPTATLGEIETECCGDPVVISRGKCSCDLVISQKICVKIPIKYSVSAKSGESMISCERA